MKVYVVLYKAADGDEVGDIRAHCKVMEIKQIIDAGTSQPDEPCTFFTLVSTSDVITNTFY
jgi:hypothetical protein